jgi:dephospho-CoA kinase
VRFIGLTGGIGSGKSTVAAAFAARGAVIVDSDAIVRELQEPGGAIFTGMVEHFGPGIVAPDGTLDRAAVAQIVFNDDDQLKALNRIVHPAVVRETTARVDAHAGTDALVVLDIPLLVEGRRDDGTLQYPVTAVIVVDLPADVAVARLVEHRGFDEADARARIAKQATREDRLSIADLVIDNSGSVDALEPQLQAAWEWARHVQPYVPATPGTGERTGTPEIEESA